MTDTAHLLKLYEDALDHGVELLQAYRWVLGKHNVSKEERELCEKLEKEFGPKLRRLQRELIRRRMELTIASVEPVERVSAR